MAELRRVPATAPIGDVVRVLREDGGVIVEDLIDAGTIAAINAEVGAHVEAADPAMRHLNPAIQIFSAIARSTSAGSPGNRAPSPRR